MTSAESRDLRRRQRRRAKKQQDAALVAVEHGLLAELDSSRFLQLLVDSAGGLFDALTGIWLPAEDGALVERITSVPGTFPEGRVVLGEGMTGRCAAERRGFRVRDYPAWPHALPRYVAAGLRQAMAQPLLIGDELLGVITMSRTGADAAPFTAEDLASLGRLAGLAALGLRNASLYEAAQRGRREAEALLTVSQIFSLDLPTPEALRRVAREVAHIFGADMVCAYSLAADGRALIPTAGYRVPKPLLQQFMETPLSIEGIAFLQQASEAGRPVWTADAVHDDRFSQTPVATPTPRAILFAPTSVRGEMIGGLFVVWWAPGRVIADAELRLVEAIATQVGLAIERRQGDETRQHLEAQLRQSQKMEAVGRLAGGIAHDFNNLLTVIRGRSELALKRPDLDPVIHGSLTLIDQTAERGAMLTRQLLSFSRRHVLQPSVVDLNEVVTGIDRMLRPLIGEDVQLMLELSTGPSPVRADTGMLEQVLLNLAVNARDAMPRGGRLTIRTADIELDETFVRAHLGARPGSHVLLEVRDTGVGMSAETQARVFEPFFTTKDPGKGTGLGLATVYGIVTQHGGYIRVESGVGQGTAFAVYLPRAEGAEPVRAGRQAKLEALPRGDETVLLVEDHEDVRALAHEILRALGYTVLPAADGASALRTAEAHHGPVQLLITDVIMPRMGGRDIADRLRARYPELRVLYISGYMSDALDPEELQRPGTALLDKPFTPETLGLKVRGVLDGPA